MKIKICEENIEKINATILETEGRENLLRSVSAQTLIRLLNVAEEYLTISNKRSYFSVNKSIDKVYISKNAAKQLISNIEKTTVSNIVNSKLIGDLL